MVKSIIRSRGTGKTKELIEQAVNLNATIVCEDVDRMTQKIHAYGYTGIRVISYLEFWAVEDQIDSNGYCIDELEKFCEVVGIKAFTLIKD